jgi:hypothetical protein
LRDRLVRKESAVSRDVETAPPDACGFEPRTAALVHGELKGRVASEALVHARGCRSCRASMIETARRSREGTEPEYSTDLDGPRPQAPWWLKAFDRRRTAVRRPFSGLMTGVLVAAVIAFFFKSDAPPPAPTVARCDLPVVTAPVGECEARPRFFSIEAPASEKRLRVIVIEAGGRLVWCRDVGADDSGTLTAAVGTDGRFIRWAVPFPESAELALEPGVRFGAVASFGDARQGAAAAFRLK